MGKTKTKRSLALLLAIVMCIGLLPIHALAADVEENLAVQPDGSSVTSEEPSPIDAGDSTAADAGGWKIQYYGQDTDVELQNGWITATDDSVILDYTKFVADTGKEGIILYNSEAPVYENSSLSFDMLVSEEAGGQEGFICMGPLTRVQDGKNCEGLGIASKYPSKTSIQRNGKVDGADKYNSITNELGLEFETGKTYSLKLDTVGTTTTVYVKVEGEYQKLASYESYGITEGTYGFRVWRGGKKITISNIERTEIIVDSFLKETEKHIPYEDWCASGVGMEIPVHFGPGDEVESIVYKEVPLSEGSDYSVDTDNSVIKMTPDFFKGKDAEEELVLTVKFTSGTVATYTYIRDPRAAAKNGWVLQQQYTDVNVMPDPAWITTTETGGVRIDYGKIVSDTGKEGWVLFDGEAPYYKNSELSYDITFTDATQAPWIAVALAPRVTSGKGYDGFAITQTTGLERHSNNGGGDGYDSISNLANVSFEYDKTYHIRMVAEESHFTVYVTVPGGEEQKLTEFDSPIDPAEGSYGFRIWRGGKTITIENVERREIIISSLDREAVQIAGKNWGAEDVSVPISLSSGDTVAVIFNGETELTAGQDYTVDDNVLTLKKEYIAKQDDTFRLKVAFAQGSESELLVVKYDPEALQEYTWTPDMGCDMWKSISGSGTFKMTEDGSAMRVTGTNALVNNLAPILANGEIEITFQALRDQDGHEMGALFRSDANNWQAVGSTDSINGEGVWDFIKNGNKNRIIWDGTQNMSYGDVKDSKIKVRYMENSITFWVDDQFAHTASVSQAETSMGGMGLYVDNQGDVLVKKVVFREVRPFEEATGEQTPKTIAKDGLTVRLDGEFPRVIDYTLNGKTLNGAELRYNYATINTVDYPATAEITASSEDSVTYHVIPDPDRTGVTFDVKFTVLDSQILEMLILNIHEPEGEQVNSIGLTQQPLISANSTQEGAMLDGSWVEENGRQFRDLYETIGNKTISTIAPRSISIPIITADGLSASMYNNALLGGEEFVFRAFDLGNGKVSVGVWNVEFMYRGMDDEKILPFPSEPDEAELYCRVVITEDTNGDDIVNWQDGANALKKLTTGIIPGGDQAARSFFHVGYNFSSGAQQPFLQVADNMKRLSNLIDGFGQQLVFKGYASEGHDSGHADYENVNQRAGGAEDMNVAVEEADKIHSNVGIHINSQEAYPEAKMFSEITTGDRDGWRWMDQSKIIRRYVDMLTGGFEERLDKLYEQVPGIDFVYVDCWGEDRWGEKKLIGTLLDNGCELFGNENAPDFVRFGVWVHSARNDSAVHQFVYNTQKDIYPGSNIYFGGYSRSESVMSWQHHNNINGLEKQFFTNQLPQKYLMCHEVLRVADGVGYFEGDVTSGGKVITKDGNKITDGENKIFIPWYDMDTSVEKDPDEAAKIYHWNSDGGATTWTLPKSWNDVTTVYLYKTTQNGKVLADTIAVAEGHQVTINAEANTGYVLYPAAAEADVTEWSVGSPLKDTNFNSRDFSIWQKDGGADIQFNDDGNGVSILTIVGKEAGQVSQAMTGLTVGQKYRVKVDAGAENGKTARITVKNGDETVTAYLEEVTRTNNYFDDYAKGNKVQRFWVDFVAAGETAEVIFSGDACDSSAGKVTFMQSRVVKTAEPDLPNGYVANETFEYVEQGAYGIFNPERSADGVPHLSETHLPYTNDTISGNWSLKLYGHYGQGNVTVRTNPGVTRLAPNTNYTVEFDTLGNGKVYVQPDATDAGRVLEENFSRGHSKFIFTTGDRNDYVIRVENASVLDNFVVYRNEDNTPPTAPTNLTAEAVDNDNAVILTWEATTDDDGQIGSYRIYRNGSDEPIAVVSKDTLTYTDRNTQDETEYTYQVSAVNLGQTEGPKSNEAAVTTKTLSPEAVTAQITDGKTITVTFNKAMEKASAEAVENYTLTGVNGITVVSAALSADGRTVTLTVAGMDVTGSVTLSLANIKDASGRHAIGGDKSFTLSALYHYFKFDEAEDTAAVDSAGHANGVKRSAKSVEGKDGSAIYVNGGYVDVDSRVLTENNEFTISTWVKWDGGSTSDNCILSNDISGDASSRGITYKIRDGKFQVTSNIGGVQSDRDVPVGEWTHLAMVKDAENVTLYLNGEAIITAKNPFDMSNQNVGIRIGANSTGSGGVAGPYKGAIDEVKIFSISLSAADIAVLAGMEPAPTPNAKFNAMTMTLSDVAKGMSYSVDKGATWVDITGTTADLSEAAVTVSNGIWVKRSGDGETTADSRIQVITLTQAAMPEGITKTDETIIGASDGTITGVTAAMEYSADGGKTWIDGTGEAITGLAPQDYLVRVKATVDALASEPLVVTIEESTVEKIMLTIDHSGLVNLKCSKDAQGDLDEHQVEYGETTAITLVPISEYYALPAQDAIEITNADGDRITGWTIDGSGTITFTDGITSSLIIKATGVVKTYAVSYILTNGLSISEADAAGRVSHKAAYTGKLVAASGYKLPESITVTMDGEEFTDFTYDNGVLTIAEGKITGDLDIIASGTADDGSSSGSDHPFIPPVIKPDEGKDDEEIKDPDTPLADLPFLDVAKDAWYAQSVANIYAKGYMKGTGDAAFSPKMALNRGMMAQIIHNMAENPSASVGAPFSDLNGRYYTEAVAWGAANGILKGYSEELFGGEDNVTREQMVVMLYRYAQSLDLCKEVDQSVLDGFTDGARVSGWAKEAMAWAVENGLIQGRGNDDLDPRANITRAEVAAVLDRFSKLFLA